jgi:hypothetical protein
MTGAEVAESAASLCRLQLPNGLIPWFANGHGDPWNHVEAAMALVATGHVAEAQAAFRWLATTQRRDGSWFNYYVGEWVSSTRLDTNVTAYVAAGLWHYLLRTGDVDTVAGHWPMVERAIDFALGAQRADGPVSWSYDDRGVRAPFALLTGSSSIFLSLECALRLAERLGEDRPHWRDALGRLGHAIAAHEEAFEPKATFAMDWYYPMLTGVVRGPQATARLSDRREDFLLGDHGVRCVSTHDWVTAAETSEFVLTLDALGRREEAAALLAATRAHRTATGDYLTGWVYPQRVTFPTMETSSYSAAAVLLAVDALADTSMASALFRDAGQWWRRQPATPCADC